MAQNDTHVALIILTTQMWGGEGELLVEKTFSGQILCSCAFGANIRSYTKQRARRGTPFLQPPPPPSAGVHVPPPPPLQSNFQVAQWRLGRRALPESGPARLSDGRRLAPLSRGPSAVGRDDLRPPALAVRCRWIPRREGREDRGPAGYHQRDHVRLPIPAAGADTPPPPCASTAAVPKNQAKQRFNAHPVLRQDHACMWHT